MTAVAGFALLVGASGVSGWVSTAPRDREAADRGERIFAQRCAVCHATTDRAAQGPGLGGVVGRRAAATPFGYTRALRDAGLTWDAATLDRFLAAPGALVPGTSMPLALPDDTERRAVVDYLTTLHADGAPPPEHAVDGPAAAAPPGLRSGRAALGDFRGDGPGVRRRISFADLPAPYATPSATNAPQVVRAPPGAAPRLPPGFHAEVFAHDLEGPRLVRASPSGRSLRRREPGGAAWRVLRAADATRGARDEVYASGLNRPFGVTFYPPGPEPRWVYVAETNAVLRFPYASGDLRASGGAQVVVGRLTTEEGGHWTRDVAFSRDGRRMFVSVGSASNVAEGDVDEVDRADVLVFDPEGHGREVYASGIRNCVGLAVHPATGDVWCSTNERDGLGDDLVPDYVTRVREGGFYGWPWFYLGAHPDPRHAGEHPELAAAVVAPDVLLQAHSASLEVAFYDAAAFPESYRGCAFASLHGSWNRGARTGPKVIVVPLHDGVPTGEYEDFTLDRLRRRATTRSWARPVGVAVGRDGSLFVSEDANGTIWRITYAGP